MAPVTDPALSQSQAGAPRRDWRLALALFPFVAAAVAVNLFMLGLIAPAVDLPTLSPVAACLVALPLGVPATWAVARWVRGLVAEAERSPAPPEG